MVIIAHKAQHNAHDSVGVGRTNQTRQEAVCKDHKQKERPGEKVSFPLELAN